MKPSERRQARILAMQALCQWDVQGDIPADQLQDFLVTHEEGTGTIGYANALLDGFQQWRKEVDKAIAASTRAWSLERLSPPERNAMRIAVVEWFTKSAPPKVALTEAIEIGREFGGAESPRFINGVLDDILKQLNLESDSN
jgi:N utilization substance protein B